MDLVVAMKHYTRADVRHVAPLPLTCKTPHLDVAAYSTCKQIQASNPLEEDVVAISTVLRQAVSVEISLSNPLEEDLQFQVSLQVGTPAIFH